MMQEYNIMGLSPVVRVHCSKTINSLASPPGLSLHHPAHGDTLSRPAEAPAADSAVYPAPDIESERGGNVCPGQSYQWKFNLLCALGFSGCMVAFMMVLAMPFFRSASPLPAGHAWDIVKVRILPSAGQMAAQSPVTPQQSPAEAQTAAHGVAATPAPPAADQAPATLPPASTPAPSEPAPGAAANQRATARWADSAIDAIASSRRATERSVTAAFQAALYDRIGRYQVYPKEALQQQLQGVVVVTFVMDRNGTVLKVSVKRTSGELILDKAAAESIVMAQPLPSIPPQLPGRLTVELPIAFSASNPQPGQSEEP
jgi:periplasmic protein TonB